MATIQGVWTFKERVPFTAPVQDITQYINFTTADGVSYTGMKILATETMYPVLLNFGIGADGWTVAIYNGETEFRWVEEEKNYKTIDFGTTEQAVSDEFYSLFVQVATQDLAVADKLTRIAYNERRVYDAGYTKGVSESYDTGYASGYADGGQRFKAFVEGTVEELNDDTITKAKAYAFAYCNSLTTITLNSLESGGTTCFGYCAALETVYLPALKTVPYTGFMNCTALKSVYVPNAGNNYGSFYNCTALPFFETKTTYINAACFQLCSSLKTLVLRSGIVAELSNLNALAGTPFRNGRGGTVYVPQALVESYKTATNWNALESVTFLPIEGSEYE